MIVLFENEDYIHDLHLQQVVEWYGLANSIHELTPMTFEANNPCFHFNSHEVYLISYHFFFLFQRVSRLGMGSRYQEHMEG